MASDPLLAARAPREKASPERQAPREHRRWSTPATQLVGLVRETFVQWQNDDASRLAASLALYTLLSIAPLLVVAIAVAGLAFGNEAARGQLSQQVGRVVGPQAGLAIEALIKNAQEPKAGLLSSGIGIVVLLFGASGVFGELQTALNQIWNVKVRPGRGWRGLIRDRFFSFTMVLGVAFLLLVSLVVSAVLVTVTTHFSHLIAWPWVWHGFNALVGLLISTLLFALIFKVVPDAKIGWRDVWVGALVTALCFSLGKTILAWYVGRSATVSPFGAAGSLVALTVWVYYSAQILFFGAEFAQVYATRFGTSIEPSDNAIRLHDVAPRARSQSGTRDAIPPGDSPRKAGGARVALSSAASSTAIPRESDPGELPARLGR